MLYCYLSYFNKMTINSKIENYSAFCDYKSNLFYYTNLIYHEDNFFYHKGSTCR
jgi:hypothetical protein